MKYEVKDTVLMSPDRNFKRDEIVTPEDLEKAGFNVDFLLKNNSIEPLKGTESDAPKAEVKSPAKKEGGDPKK